MKLLIILVVFIVLGGAWYLTRPEKLFIQSKVDEGFPESGNDASPMVLYTGTFHGVSHHASGVATVYAMSDGHRILRFTDFEVSNGPDVHVYLVATDDANDNETVKKAETIGLGPMKGNVGNQNYDLPDDVDLAEYRSVTIWCKRFGINFATAPLTASK